ncbi:DUF1835 domain-containing protein [Polaribacter sp. WD7]|uniref:DUF1835 domain-containing protein n=1 Tax=Polaribacter sp. WD7 TaxID=2269061 RepID=UPI000DF1D96D|nr:DUF1835 domain-containing protein [Polaribacter sp. WD7]RCS26806.1 DUF1835 domain-containing protein [Polaribacter sp. WD7]
MNPAVLHITNGDSTTNYLKKLKFSGEFITWREMLCEGKTTADVGSESFWKNRFVFFKTSYKVSKKRFIDFTVKEYRNLCNKKDNKEIILWFEYDLFCQINMLAVLSWLKSHRKGHHISLVCSGKVKGSKKLKSIGELTANQIDQYYKNRVCLTQDDIEYADYIWQLYCANSPLRLETVYRYNPMSPFQYLTTALEAHLRRFPTIYNGLNAIENNILNTANTKKLSSKNALISQILKEDTTYGFGDLQFKYKIDQLQKLFESFHPVKLSKKGNKILEGQTSYYGTLRNDNAYLGGTKKYSFLFNTTTEKLLQITS